MSGLHDPSKQKKFRDWHKWKSENQPQNSHQNHALEVSGSSASNAHFKWARHAVSEQLVNVSAIMDRIPLLNYLLGWPRLRSQLMFSAGWRIIPYKWPWIMAYKWGLLKTYYNLDDPPSRVKFLPKEENFTFQSHSAALQLVLVFLLLASSAITKLPLKKSKNIWHLGYILECPIGS